MTNLVRTFRKAVAERRRFYLDYGCWMADDEVLTDFQVTISPFISDAPITVTTSYPDAAHRKLMVFVGGGKANTNYTLSMLVHTDAGQAKQDDIGLRVTP